MNIERNKSLSVLKDRLSQALASKLTDVEALQIALSVRLRDATVAGLLFSRTLHRAIGNQGSSLGITPTELESIIGASASTHFSKRMDRVVALPGFVKLRARLERVLVATLQEKEQQQLWTRPHTQLCAVLAVHLDDDPEVALGKVLKLLVKSDTRRLEELSDELEDAPTDPLLLADVVLALSDA